MCSSWTLFPKNYHVYMPTSAKSANLYARGLAVFDVQLAASKVYEKVAGEGALLDAISLDDPPWHIAYLASLKGSDTALAKVIAERPPGARRVLVLDMVDPFTPLLRLQPFRDLPYFVDPTRANSSKSAVAVALRADAQLADVLVVPLCPATLPRAELLKTFPPSDFDGRTRVALNECWVAYVRPL